MRSRHGTVEASQLNMIMGGQEDEYGRARVTTQWADDAEYVSEAIDLCPVDCISYVPRDQLALLEFVMKSCKREDPAILARRYAYLFLLFRAHAKAP